MADRSHGARTPNIEERHSWSSDGLQQQHHPVNQVSLHQEPNHVEPAPDQPNGVRGIEPSYELGRPGHPAPHEHDARAGDPSSSRIFSPGPLGQNGGSPLQASNQSPHDASPNFGDGRPYQFVDRTTYRSTVRLPNVDSGPNDRGEDSEAPHQVSDPMQRFRTETMREQAWNGLQNYQPVTPPSPAREGEPEPSHSAGTSRRVENGSSSSLGRQY